MTFEQALAREVPDTSLAGEFDGEPLVQSFRVGSGRVWITTAEALEVPGFGRPWVAARLAELRAELGPEQLEAELAAGLRLRAAALALAA
jgi:hypothetical protein